MLKYFFKIYIPLVLLTILIISYLGWREIKSGKILIESTEEVGHIRLQLRTIAEGFRDIVSDLNYLSEHHSLHELVNNTTEYAAENLSHDYLSFAKSKGLYDQIRFIDNNGSEVVRINYNNNSPYIVQKDSLSNKSSRYYFKLTMALGKGEIFVSPMDLNIEKGEVEIPFKPMIRLATPIWDKQGKKQGIIIINYLASILINNLKTLASTAIGEVSLINSKGYWFIGLSSADEWGFMFEDRKEKMFQSSFQEAWKKISEENSGQFYTSEGLFTFDSVFPLLEVKNKFASSFKTVSNKDVLLEQGQYQWKTVSRIKPSLLNSRSNRLLTLYFQYFLIFATFLCLPSWYFANNISRARQTHRDIAAAKEELEHVNISLKESITKRKNSEKELKVNKHYLEKAQELGKLGSWEIDINTQKILWTDETYRIFSIPQTTLIDYETFINCVHPDDREYVNKEWEKALSGNPYDLEHRVVANGIVCWVREKAELSYDDDGRAIRAIGFVQDITEKKMYEEQIKRMALYDSLTGLANRYQLNRRFDESLAYAKRYNLNTGFLMIDLDNFKPINDSLGHHVGDETLKKVAKALSDTCRETDLVTRIGGDEFAVLVSTINDDDRLDSLANRIVSSLTVPMMIMGHNVEISVSIGIAKYPDDGENQDELMRKADVALYAVKNSGRNGFKFYQSAMNAE